MKFQVSLNNLGTAVLLMSAISFSSCGGGTSTDTTNEDTMTTMGNRSEMSGQMASAVLSGTNPDTTVTGTVRFEEANGKIKMMMDVTVPKKANSSVAVHIHEHGSCGDMGKEAHGHWNPTNVNHGKWGSGSFHAGDIGNVALDGEGKGTMELETDLWSIGGDSNKNILDKAIIVHGGVDDFKTQPTGNAGSRIGCGVITKS